MCVALPSTITFRPHEIDRARHQFEYKGCYNQYRCDNSIDVSTFTHKEPTLHTTTVLASPH